MLYTRQVINIHPSFPCSATDSSSSKWKKMCIIIIIPTAWRFRSRIAHRLWIGDAQLRISVATTIVESFREAYTVAVLQSLDRWIHHSFNSIHRAAGIPLPITVLLHISIENWSGILQEIRDQWDIRLINMLLIIATDDHWANGDEDVSTSFFPNFDFWCICSFFISNMSGFETTNRLNRLLSLAVSNTSILRLLQQKKYSTYDGVNLVNKNAKRIIVLWI